MIKIQSRLTKKGTLWIRQPLCDLPFDDGINILTVTVIVRHCNHSIVSSDPNESCMGVGAGMRFVLNQTASHRLRRDSEAERESYRCGRTSVDDAEVVCLAHVESKRESQRFFCQRLRPRSAHATLREEIREREEREKRLDCLNVKRHLNTFVRGLKRPQSDASQRPLPCFA